MKKDGWFAAKSPAPMFGHLKAKATERKQLLFVAACLRRAWHFALDERFPRLLDTLEAVADGGVKPRARAAARERCFRVADSDLDDMQQCLGYELWHALKVPDERTAGSLGEWAAAAFGYHNRGAAPRRPRGGGGAASKFQRGKAAERREQVALVRELFGDPFRRAKFDPAWRTDTVVVLARQMYDTREFSAAPILADALQDAGCADAPLLEHLRGPGPHYRGCWALDAVLGRA